jgi:hypothetical protein
MVRLLSFPSPYGRLGSSGQKTPLPQESEVGPAEHLTFEHPDSVDGSFGDADLQMQGSVDRSRGAGTH